MINSKIKQTILILMLSMYDLEIPIRQKLSDDIKTRPNHKLLF